MLTITYNSKESLFFSRLHPKSSRKKTIAIKDLLLIALMQATTRGK